MLLYVNGNDICGGAKCINNYRVAREDSRHTGSGNKSHPDNVMHSFGYYLSKGLGLGMRVEATVKDNDAIYNETLNFIDNHLPKLKSFYTVIVIGWSPSVDSELVEQLATKLSNLNLEFIFFNTEESVSKKLSFSNLIDLNDQQQCFLPWCRAQGYTLTEDYYPGRDAHEAWARHLFHLMIENQ